jgi:hypothetical protein
MKTIMDCERNPKKAYFEYRNALEPLTLSLRTDRFTYYEGEKIDIEAFICNDTHLKSKDYKIVYELYSEGKALMHGEMAARFNPCEAKYSSSASLVAPKTDDRTKYLLRAILVDENGRSVTYKEQSFEVFKHISYEKNDKVRIITDLPVGEHMIAGERVTVKECGMLPLHFASRKTGHEFVKGLEARDVSYFFDKKADMITPLLKKTFTADGFTPILLSGNKDEHGDWCEVYAAAEKVVDGVRTVICFVDLREENPIAERLLAAFNK